MWCCLTSTFVYYVLFMFPPALAQNPPLAPTNAYWSDHGGFTDSCPYLCYPGFTRDGVACVPVTTTPTPGIYVLFGLQVDSASPPTEAQIQAYKIVISDYLIVPISRISIAVQFTRRRLLAMSGYVITVTFWVNSVELAAAYVSQVQTSRFQLNLNANSPSPTTYVSNSAGYQIAGG